MLPVYIFDPREYPCGNNTPNSGRGHPVGVKEEGKNAANGRNGSVDCVGPNRAHFILQSVKELRERLRALGSDLIIRVGLPEEVRILSLE
jgi:hypothetical protein